MIRMPAEWEFQSAVMIAWPHPGGDFGAQLEAVENSYGLIAKTIAERQGLFIVCKDREHRQHVVDRLKSAVMTNIRFALAPFNDMWVRDTAPISIDTARGIELLDFRFNGWGGKYAFLDDDALSLRLYEQGLFGDAAMRRTDMVLEGGSLESDGQGTLLTTRQCLLNPNRNPALSQSGIESRLKELLGFERILWLDQDNLEGDDTDAHIDTLARFCSTDTIAYTSCEDPRDPHFDGLKDMESQLKKLAMPSGDSYRLVALPLPKAIYSDANQRLPANYANFLIINGAVLIPAYDDPMDEVVFRKLSGCFPDREIIPIPCIPLVHQYGSLHCMTMQFYPSNPKSRRSES
ncbi:MAG: agmatine deiminase family protein [Gammaproteobacteria bacterium]